MSETERIVLDYAKYHGIVPLETLRRWNQQYKAAELMLGLRSIHLQLKAHNALK